MAPSVLMRITFKRAEVQNELRSARDRMVRELRAKEAEIEEAASRIGTDLSAGRFDVPNGVPLLLDHLRAAGLATPELVKRMTDGELFDAEEEESIDDLKRPATA